MSRATKPHRGRRGEVRLVERDGAWTIYWGRALARELGCPRRESTGTADRPEAERILRVRLVEVARRRGDQAGVDALRRTAPAVPLDVLVSDFLRALAAGDLPGAKPRPSTLEGYMAHLLGARGGLVAFARSVDRATSDRLDRVLVERWLEAERGRAAPDTLRLKLIAARRLAAFAEQRALIPPERLAAIRDEWLDEPSGCVLVRVGEGFDTKSHASRIVDGVDAETFALAREVLAMKARKPFSVSGYTMALKRACKRLARAGTPWKYRSKTHGLRSAYATASRMAGVPLSVVRDRMGHESERTTERHYLGRVTELAVAGPFQGVPRLASATSPGAAGLRSPGLPANDNDDAA